MKLTLILALIMTLSSFGGYNLTTDRAQLEQELNSFCETYATQNWEHIQGIGSINEIESYVNNLAKNSVDNQQLKDIIDEIAQVEFYRQIYPEIKKKVEALYGNEWSCPELQAFYTPTITKPIEENSLSTHVILNTSGEFFIEGKKLSLNESDIDGIKPYFTVNETRVDKVYVELEEETPDILLQPLLSILPSMGIQNITIEETKN